MTRQAPDRAFAAAAREALVRTTSASAVPRRGRPRLLFQAVVAAVVLLIVAGGTIAVIRLVPARSGFAAAPADAPVTDPGRVHCGGSRDDGLLPFGCADFMSSDGHDGSGEIDWLQTQPMRISFSVLGVRPQIDIDVHCNFTSADVALSTSSLQVDESSASTTLTACGDDRTPAVLAFFKSAVQYTLSGDALTLASRSTVIHLHRTETTSAIAAPEHVHCAAGTGDSVAPFGCGVFRAVDGRDARGPIDWLPSSRTGLQLYWQGSNPVATVSGPCDSSSDVRVTLYPDRIVLDAHRGWSPLPVCTTSAALHDRQIFDLFDGSVTYSLSGDDLTLANGGTVIHLRRQSTN